MALTQREMENLENNLGSNWREIYDPVNREYINGYSYDTLTDGRIGTHRETGEDIGGRDKDGNYRWSSTNGRINAANAYQDRIRREQLNRGKKQVDQYANNASRQAYVNYAKAQDKLPQQIASVGGGGFSESSALALQTGYNSHLSDIDRVKQQGYNDLETQYRAGAAMDALAASQRFMDRQEAEAERKRQENLAYDKAGNSTSQNKTTSKKPNTLYKPSKSSFNEIVSSGYMMNDMVYYPDKLPNVATSEYKRMENDFTTGNKAMQRA